jgi:CBS domain-containing protein
MITKVHDLMRRGVIFCYRDDTVKQVAEMMVTNGIRSIAVVDETGGVCGSISRLDLLQHYGKDLRKIKAKDILRPYEMDIDPQLPIADAVETMKRQEIQFLLVTESYTAEKRLVGILTNYDIVRYMSGTQSGRYETLLKARL